MLAARSAGSRNPAAADAVHHPGGRGAVRSVRAQRGLQRVASAVAHRIVGRSWLPDPRLEELSRG